jgi:hypothetical protein
MFTLDAHVLGDQRTVSAEQDGLGITVTTSQGLHRARSMEHAIRIARDDMGDFLRPAQRPGVPWGLCVRVADVSAYYGEVRFCRAGGGAPLPHNDLVSRIRRRWHERQGPHAALENAIEIIRSSVGRSAGRRAA